MEYTILFSFYSKFFILLDHPFFLFSLHRLIILFVMAFLNKRQTLWRDGEATIPYVSPDACISREKRFKHFSIYWPEKTVCTQTIKAKRSEAD